MGRPEGDLLDAAAGAAEGGRMMAELKPCPFCGNKPEITDCSGVFYYRNKMGQTAWRKYLREEIIEVGSRRTPKKFYVFDVTEFTVKCSSPSCFARNASKRFHSMQELIEAWNRRADDGKAD